tara:strand:+ start:1287 stop:1490 length:204 start_codon:yes stop_codon:yes gene_type:complete
LTNSINKHTPDFAASSERITATRIQKIKRQAKDLAGREDITHMEALDLVCAQGGLGMRTEIEQLKSK